MNKNKTGGSVSPLIKNKRGFLLGEETIKIILAIIAILFLILFIVYLYNNFTQNKELDEAKSTLANLVTQLNSGASQFNIYNPTDWLLMSFAPINGGYYPKSCTANKWAKCLCMCINDLGAATNPTCDDDGICQQSDFVVSGQTNVGAGTGVNVPPVIAWKSNSILISNPPVLLSIDQSTKTISKGQ